MAFQFRFQFLLELKKSDRDKTGASLGQANEAVGKIETQIAQILEQIETLRAGHREGRVGTVSVDAMLTRERYELQLQADHQALLETQASLLQEVHHRQMLLALAEAEVKKFEKLRQREHETHTKRQLKREQEEIDDLASARYRMKRRKMNTAETGNP